MPRIRPALHARWIFILCLLILGTAGGVAGTTLLIRWQTDRVTADVRLLLERDVRQIRFALKSWEKSFQLLRDALDKVPRRAEAEQTALARSAVEHTSYLSAVGWIGSGRAVHWWVPPPDFSPLEKDALGEQIRRRGWWKTFLGLPVAQTFSLQPGRAFLQIDQPLRGLENRTRRLLVLYNLTPFFAETLGLAGVRVVDHGVILYEFPDRGGASRSETFAAERILAEEGIRWTIQRQRVLPPTVPTRWLNALLGLAILLSLAALAGILWAAERLRYLATTDGLTGLYNRRFFLERLEEEVERANRYRRPISCLMVDLDGFKQVNDQQGHAAGDRVLQQVGQELQSCLRRSDILARFGGDEFAAVLPETSLEQASAVARKLRGISAAGAFAPVRLSVGLAVLNAGDTAHDILQKADEDLYATRTAVRNNGGGKLEQKIREI